MVGTNSSLWSLVSRIMSSTTSHRFGVDYASNQIQSRINREQPH